MSRNTPCAYRKRAFSFEISCSTISTQPVLNAYLSQTNLVITQDHHTRLHTIFCVGWELYIVQILLERGTKVTCTCTNFPILQETRHIVQTVVGGTEHPGKDPIPEGYTGDILNHYNYEIYFLCAPEVIHWDKCNRNYATKAQRMSDTSSARRK